MCFKKRTCPALFLAVISLVVFILSIVILALTVKLQSGGLYQSTADIEEVQNGLDIYSAVLYGFSAVALVTALLGCAAAKIKNRCPVFLFGTFSFFVMFVYIIVGALLVGIVMVSGSQIDKFCTGGYNEGSVGSAYQYVLDVDQFYYEVGRNMCRKTTCPCPAEYQAPWSQASSGLTEAQMNSMYGRTYDQSKDDGSFGAGNMIYLYFDPDTNANTFDKFSQCLTRGSLGESDSDLVEYFMKVQSFIDWFETTSQCTGICTKSLFFVSLGLEDGRPKVTCLNGIKELISNNMYGLGVCILITGLILFIAFIFQYCLWKKRD